MDISKVHLYINEMSRVQCVKGCSHFHFCANKRNIIPQYHMSCYTPKHWRVKYYTIKLNHLPLSFLSLSVHCVYWWCCGSLTAHSGGWLMVNRVSADSFIMPGVILIYREQHTATEELFSKILNQSRMLTVCLGFWIQFYLFCLPSASLHPIFLSSDVQLFCCQVLY